MHILQSSGHLYLSEVSPSYLVLRLSNRTHHGRYLSSLRKLRKGHVSPLPNISWYPIHKFRMLHMFLHPLLQLGQPFFQEANTSRVFALVEMPCILLKLSTIGALGAGRRVPSP